MKNKEHEFSDEELLEATRMEYLEIIRNTMGGRQSFYAKVLHAKSIEEILNLYDEFEKDVKKYAKEN